MHCCCLLTKDRSGPLPVSGSPSKEIQVLLPLQDPQVSSLSLFSKEEIREIKSRKVRSGFQGSPKGGEIQPWPSSKHRQTDHALITHLDFSPAFMCLLKNSSRFFCRISSLVSSSLSPAAESCLSAADALLGTATASVPDRKSPNTSSVQLQVDWESTGCNTLLWNIYFPPISLPHQLTIFFGTFVLLVLDLLLWFLPSGFNHTLDSLLGFQRLLKRLHYRGSSDFAALLCIPAGR